jgi:hypothetical protein
MRTAEKCEPARLYAPVDELPALMMTVVKKKLIEAKAEDVDPHNPNSPVKRAQEMLYIIVKCMFTLRRLPGIEQNCPKFIDFHARILATVSLKPMIQRVQEEQNKN